MRDEPADNRWGEAHDGRVERRRRTEPEPVQIELVALDATRDRGRDAARPPPGGVGTLPPITTVVGRVVARVADVPDPPLLPGRSDRAAWSDQCVHRLVRLPPWEAEASLRAMVPVGRPIVVGVGARRPTRVRIGRRARLELLRHDADAGPIRVHGHLHVHRWRRSTPVLLTLDPWSAHRSDLCLQPVRRGRGAGLPRRYYDVAHVVMDVVWHQLERARPA